MNLDPYLTPDIEVNFRWITGINGKDKTIKLKEEKGKCVCGSREVKTQKVQTKKSEIDKLSYVKIRNVQSLKNNIKKV